ncbi:MAG TPA: ATP-binding protein [Verrucomicrobiae bacterium]|nr:ATP-binding protein [Verrucomicrobiae bacterium]
MQIVLERGADEILRTLVESAPEAIVVFNGETGRFELVNENAVRLFGRTREELLRLTPAEVSPPFQRDGRPSAECATEKIREALAGRMPVFDWLHKHPSGRVFTAEVRLVRLPGDRPLVRASVMDTTERRRREQTQRAVYEMSEAAHTEANLPRLYARIHDIIRGLMPADNFFIALFDPATEIISFPYFVDELAESPPEPRKVSTGLTGLVLRTGKAILTDPEFVKRSRKEGDRVTVENLDGLSYVESGRSAAVWLGVPLLMHGEPIGVMAVQDYQNGLAYGEDEKQILSYVATQTAVAIERKRTEDSLRELVEKHRALFEASGQGVMLHDDKQFLEANPAAVRILGLKHVSEVIGRHPAEFAPPFQPSGETSASFAQRKIEECMEKGSVHFEWDGLRADGTHFPVDVLLTRIQFGGRWVIQAMVEDITERKRAEAELLKSLAREKELSQMKSNFVSMVSHEFRTPLGIIMSSAQILGDYFDRLTAAERSEHLRSITGNSRHMSNLMEEALVLSRVDAGKMLCEPALLDLGALCRRITDESLSACRCGGTINLNVAPDCEVGRGDERLLRHIFTNLLSNALKYSSQGAPIDFEVTREGSEAVFAVRDRGIGIPEADREWLFEPFHRGRNVENRPGTGLGLTIVKRCVELHGGRISVQSEVGRGAEFTVRLPLFPPDEKIPEPVEP